jgi:glycosyltransferase involved in cell wall biosynthesis
VADPVLPVPPITYGGVERILDFLAEGVDKNGWDVTLLCHPDSSCNVNRITYPYLGLDRKSRLKNLVFLASHLLKNKYDILHSFGHFDMVAPLWPLRQNIIQSFQSIPDWKAFTKRTRLIPKRNFHITTCGFHMIDKFSSIAPTTAIHNGVKIEQFDFQPNVAADASLVFLGRIEPIKGTHTAIEIAKATGRKLIIAGNRSGDPLIDRYFEEQVEPHFSERIRYIGPVNDLQKNKLLGEAAALMMPIDWDEPFGIVMAEALACGTPVIGFNRGALPEIVDNGVTGACCNNISELIEATRNLNQFSRSACRAIAENKFSSDIVIDQYISLYDKILSTKPIGTSSSNLKINSHPL